MKNDIGFLSMASAAMLACAAPAFCQEETATHSETTVDQGAPGTYSKTVETTRSVPDTAVRRQTVTQQTTGNNTVVDIAPDKPDTVTRKTVVNETSGNGDSRRVETSRTINGDGYMAREEYHEQQNQ